MTWRPSEHPAVAMPVGGVGTGSLAMASDGAWRQIQLMNVGKHRGDLPGTFLALRTMRHVPPHDSTVILQEARADGVTPATPMVDDDVVPAWQRRLVEEVGGTRTAMRATYPIAEVTHDTGSDVDVTVRVTSPMQPTDLDASGVPVALVDVTLTNRADVVSRTWLAHSALNAVGLDPHVNPRGVRAPGLGGNVNEFRRDGRRGVLAMRNPSVYPASSWAGSMALACEADLVVALPCFTEPDELVEAMRQLAPWGDGTRTRSAPYLNFAQTSAPSDRFGPSPAGSTWMGALIAFTELEPGETKQVRFVLSWAFPNRFVDFVQYGPDRPEHGATRFWLGNHYTRRWPDATATAHEMLDGWEDAWAPGERWASVLGRLDLPETWRTHLATQAVTLRTPTVFRTHDGACYGFEGVLGASTPMWSGLSGGSCPLNCTHVWNYAQAAAAIWPAWEASMRATELDVMLADSGALPHRVYLPTYLRQHGDGPIGAPEWPALDGMCGALLKLYRELRRGAISLDWLRERWEKVTRLMDHIARTWDPDGTGLLHGVQPSTHDIGLNGTNSFMGTFWLAALRAAEEMAKLLGATDRADEWRGRFEVSSKALDEACFVGGFYIQIPDSEMSDKDQWGDGCLADQLIGQWWAHELELGYLLPEEHVKEALANVVRHNLVDDASTTDQRAYAVDGEAGLVMCTWPNGGRPEHPTMYCDEVWTGCEYEVAAHCFREGLVDEGTAVVEAIWRRHDGRLRNPFNEVECGDHYARAMAGWSVLEARLGLRWNALDGTLTLGGDGTFPVLTGSGWGEATLADGELTLTCHHGELPIRRVVVGAVSTEVGAGAIAAGATTTLRVE